MSGVEITGADKALSAAGFVSRLRVMAAVASPTQVIDHSFTTTPAQARELARIIDLGLKADAALAAPPSGTKGSARPKVRDRAIRATAAFTVDVLLTVLATCAVWYFTAFYAEEPVWVGIFAAYCLVAAVLRTIRPFELAVRAWRREDAA